MPRKTNDTEKNVAKTKKENTTSKVSKTNTKSTKKTATTTKASNKTTKSKTSTSNKTKKETPKKSTIKKVKKSEPVSVIEYYDLPYRYNQTIVKILAQTPQMLFVYWDISDEDRKAFEERYGNDFFSKTKPVLIVHNETLNYSFEIEINDFANSWYLHVNDANSKYEIELGRKPLSYNSTIKEEYIYISSSNEMTAPNNHILFEKFNPNITYKNTKTGDLSSKDFSSIQEHKNIEKIYNIYDLYKNIYKDELFNEIIENEVANPSSNSFSSFKQRKNTY